MIKALEEMIRRFCPYGLEFKDSDFFTHDLCTLIPALELEYETSVHYSTGKTPAMLKDTQKLSIRTLFIVALNGTNAAQLESKHPTFPGSHIKPYQPAGKELVPLRNTTPFTVPPVERN
ncbi:hypothetical protein O181_000272 [Austropuccinia psidii MF-1]|uniref:Uncharacterized protein n=1 Tax=Austropuccinia psidii MF-1 TaxID=1389203 RepID=A0A9Q3GBW7_9BASI|nr:hypothetical protein [Austropuccinia psidii MF-1]